MGLDWSIDRDGYFYPLADSEQIYIGEADTAVTIEDGVEVYFGMGYAVLYKGTKFLAPTSEVTFDTNDPADRARVLAALNRYATDFSRVLTTIGGHAFVSEDLMEDRHEIQVLVPFEYAKNAASGFEHWKLHLEWLLTPVSPTSVS
ncbi:hypothetical protein [Microvirga tunisiensis]|uniref:Uncharacterized protein n=1 Tax=Microvirga tunisiensis TaxID=2108360 RepID=A0A5N7MM10_9HYPH|nr:hypothetical protein [Microvirga tunisiensis]MPR09845.1 hypothetical protein [Microvirga tunisiensis]MPR28037.1 hypothetical protein [Microvirga tunisiensis]